jgi:hypothetical protein
LPTRKRNLGVWEQRRGSPDTEISAERDASGLGSTGHAGVPKKLRRLCAESVNLLGFPVNLLVAVSVFVVLGTNLRPIGSAAAAVRGQRGVMVEFRDKGAGVTGCAVAVRPGMDASVSFVFAYYGRTRQGDSRLRALAANGA